ncbi:spindle assembly abnormal protein 6 homolog [Anopheles cruzii]|uniref:spindle assembly abnormal protein 6 homolog n=1 Tax=Anopheles cruzii TaxID=68878 RepID=UPI0022EC4A98|nr:spindle assembly abnormal protein 6 homolog [Anopheles cruzii]
MDSYFVSDQRRRCVKVLFPEVCLLVDFESFCNSSQQKFFVVIEKIDTQNLIQIRLTQMNDRSKICISTIDNARYEEIRTQQSLHVTFQGFIDHLIKILESCKSGELHIALSNGTSGHVMHLYEKRAFKNLTHLFLPMEFAPTETVLYHINESLQTLQAQTTSFSAELNKCQLEIDFKDGTIEKLTNEIRGLKGKLIDQENLIFSRNTEEVKQLYQTIKHMDESKDIEEKRYKAIINSMQEKIDQLTKESSDRAERMVQEAKHNNGVREENSKLLNLNEKIKDELERLRKELSTKQNREGKAEGAIVDMRKQFHDMQTKMIFMEKLRSEMEAELEAEKNICQTKKKALQLTTDELAKTLVDMNSLRNENLELKSKVDRRTEIAMRQEKMMIEKDKQLKELNDTLMNIQQEHIRNRAANEEHAQTVKRIKELSNAIEEKYRKKINDMIMKISNNVKHDEMSVMGNHLFPANVANTMDSH